MAGKQGVFKRFAAKHKNHYAWPPAFSRRITGVWIAVIAVFLVAGAYSMYDRLANGMSMIGATNYVPWGLWVVVYIWFSGLAGGLYLLSALAYLLRLKRFAPLARLSLGLSIISLIISMMFIGLDLGSIRHSLNVLLFFHWSSALSWEIKGYIFFLVLSIVQFVLVLLNDRRAFIAQRAAQAKGATATSQVATAATPSAAGAATLQAVVASDVAAATSQTATSAATSQPLDTEALPAVEVSRIVAASQLSDQVQGEDMQRRGNVNLAIRILAGIGVATSFVGPPGGTGLFFAAVKTRGLWQGGITSLLFYVMAIATAAAFLLVAYRLLACLRKTQPQKATVSGLVAILSGSMLALAFCVFYQLATALLADNPRIANSVQVMLSGWLAPLFWVGEIGIGMVVPAVLLGVGGYHARMQRGGPWAVGAALAALVGIFFLRYVFVVAGFSLPVITGLPNPLYVPTAGEILVTIFVMGLTVAGYGLAVRLLPLERWGTSEGASRLESSYDCLDHQGATRPHQQGNKSLSPQGKTPHSPVDALCLHESLSKGCAGGVVQEKTLAQTPTPTQAGVDAHRETEAQLGVRAKEVCDGFAR